MDGLFSTIRFFFGCGTLLVISFIVIAHLPKSPLRTLLVQVCGWAAAAFCAGYVISPWDVIPDPLFPIGFFDDAIAVFVGIKSALAAMKAGREDATDNPSSPADREAA